MTIQAIHTSDMRAVERLWLLLGGSVLLLRRTGEKRFVHEAFDSTLRVNARRKDPPAKLLSRINQLRRMAAANDPIFIAR